MDETVVKKIKNVDADVKDAKDAIVAEVSDATQKVSDACKIVASEKMGDEVRRAEKEGESAARRIINGAKKIRDKVTADAKDARDKTAAIAKDAKDLLIKPLRSMKIKRLIEPAIWDRFKNWRCRGE
ncbi:hypothetical protein K0M31_006775 [Melipona bicolor]|uniref:Uncharacterized protein n=1 Tax=Melipona bicolor TaxID=60889 RepID=A0AA40FS92_9HYME|nr:hypothetical protein K0M31_006775 [Melipona bicolor]